MQNAVPSLGVELEESSIYDIAVTRAAKVCFSKSQVLNTLEEIIDQIRRHPGYAPAKSAFEVTFRNNESPYSNQHKAFIGKWISENKSENVYATITHETQEYFVNEYIELPIPKNGFGSLFGFAGQNQRLEKITKTREVISGYFLQDNPKLFDIAISFEPKINALKKYQIFVSFIYSAVDLYVFHSFCALPRLSWQHFGSGIQSKIEVIKGAIINKEALVAEIEQCIAGYLNSIKSDVENDVRNLPQIDT